MNRWAVLLAGLLGLAGCRIEPTPPSGPVDERATGDSSGRDTSVAASDRMPADTAVLMGRPVEAPSGLVVPVAGVRPGDLVDTFDDARSEGRVHDAIDIPATRGTPVVAAAPGTVAKLFTSERGGLTVYVVGRDGRTVYYYAHLDAYAAGLDAADTVERGAILGTVGSTGNAAPENPHLHFAIWRTRAPGEFWEGDNVNPYPLLAGR
jgi:murein DD-endopeptidase MepM/ murein hydrolase activator NlpD